MPDSEPLEFEALYEPTDGTPPPAPEPIDFSGYDFSPEELRQRMGLSAFEFRQAIEGMRALEVIKGVRSKKTMVILGARQFHMLQNTKLRDYLYATFTADPKLRPTKEQYEAWVHVEHQQLYDEYAFWEAQAKQAEKDHDHWARQLSWYQSELKHEGIELLTLEGSKGVGTSRGSKY